MKKTNGTVKLFIDDMPVEVKQGTTLLAAAEQRGISIPHLCFHPAFPPEGSCRMCLVEIEGLPKLELSCSTQVREGMKIWTKSEKVVEARMGVLEFLLAEHPLDCPICDKAGECSLQDYYDEHGLFESQFIETKEKRDKKFKIGKSLILDRERCILCTRCVRFLKEVTKTQDLGIFNRGLHSEIGTYEGQLVDNNYSGNLAQICPVGAITDLDFRFKTRSWFLKKGNSICPLCSRGCSIIIEYHPGFPRIPRKQRVYRITARENPDVNGPWICDLGRYGYSFLDENRLESLVSNNNTLGENPGWEKALQFMVKKVKKYFHMKKTNRIAVVANSWLTNEELFLIRKIFKSDLKLRRIFFADPSQGEGDNFLLTPERTPNKKGAEAMGFDFKPINLEELTSKTDVLFIFGHYLLDRFGPGEVKTALEGIESIFLFSSFTSDLSSLASFVFPTALCAEKEGSLMNVDGRIQSFRPALEPVGESRAEWKILVDFARELRINYVYYKRFTSPGEILKEIKKQIPSFRKEK